MGLLDTITAGLFGKAESIADASALADFMDSRAAFMAQKCVVEFCRVRSGVYWQKLFSEKEFQAELTKSRWLSYPPAYAMVAEMAEGVLRPAAGIRQRKLPGVLANLARQTFSGYKVPDGTTDDFWTAAAELVEARLEATQSGPPRPVRMIPKPTARLIFNALPMHKDIVTNDYDYIFNNLRMNLLRAHEDLLQAGDLVAIADDLLGER
ncbi:hypothetical protein [Mesorhizobium sp. KR9-304]|uniref:hypothetical protein n=1 Tax=Mesorhizobium sp. KR9-304 TaxID=3156614 RepID=UPI0032B5C592